jgi:hypothetical protein
MRRLQIVRPCPGIPAGLIDALDRDGEAHCERCGETVVDLTRGTSARVARCARILVVATALASCTPQAIETPAAPQAAAPNPSSTSDYGFRFSDDPLAHPIRAEVGALVVAPADDAPLTMEPGR